MNVGLREAVIAAAGRQDVLASVRGVYEAVQAAIDTRRPVCSMSGRCCHFEQYGHRLYVSTLELAAFVAELPVASCPLPVKEESRASSSLPLLPTGNRQLPTDSCPFQINNLCSVHAIRPFGCRMFFCDESATDWQNEAYERFHAELKALHLQRDVPYFYVEWRAALRELGLMPESLSSTSG